MPEYRHQTSEFKNSGPSPKELLFKYLPYLPWVLLSLSISISLAWLKLRYSTPIYGVSGKLLVKDENPYGNNAEKFGNIFGLPNDNTNLNNEIEIIKSRSMAARVGRKIGFQQQYAIKGKILTSEAHVSDIPFSWIIQNMPDSFSNKNILVSVISPTQFRLNDLPETYNFGQVVNRPDIQFRLIPIRDISVGVDPIEFVLSWKPIDGVAASLSGGIVVSQLEGASVLNVSYSTPNTKNGLDIINTYMKVYQQAGLEDKKMIAFNTLQFIDDQLDTLQRELGGVEKRLQNFREMNKIFNPEVQGSQSLAQFSETQRSLAEQGVKLKIIDYLTNYMADARNQEKLVPSNLGIEESSLTQQIIAFNQLQLQRETLLKTTTQENPSAKAYLASLNKLRSDILQNLQNVKTAYMLSYKEISSLNTATESNIKSIPGKEKQLLEVTRRQAILQELYSFLLQKKLETAISSASTISDIKILEPAIARYDPISPNRNGLFTISIFLGLALPALIIFLVEFLNDKVNSRNDIERITQVPILGEVGHSDIANALVVKENNRSYIAEQFRIIRSNLQYVLPKNENPVILVTSSFSGEGKSFISTNLGAVLALSGKRTVILEMDIRKPKILKGLGMQERKGITNYIVSNISIDEITHAVPGVEGMFVIPCGPVPPNPAEMLLDEKLVDMLTELKRKYDAIIIDSAPVGLVSDALSLATLANASVYIVRHNYTLKKQIFLLDEIYKNGKLPHLSVVINDIKTKIGYGSYYGYGYGYGHGKGITSNDYFNDSKPSLLGRVKNYFKKY